MINNHNYLRKRNISLQIEVKDLRAKLNDVEGHFLQGMKFHEKEPCPSCAILTKQLTSKMGWNNYHRQHTIPAIEKEREDIKRRHERATKLICNLKRELSSKEEINKMFINVIAQGKQARFQTIANKLEQLKELHKDIKKDLIKWGIKRLIPNMQSFHIFTSDYSSFTLKWTDEDSNVHLNIINIAKLMTPYKGK